MRNVLRSNHEVAHYWANRIQGNGRSGSVFFEGDTIYSYGKHFPMARHIPGDVVLITTQGYSPTTGQHLSLVRSASRQHEQLFVHDVRADAVTVHNDNVKRLLVGCAAALVKSKRARTYADSHLSTACELHKTAVRYAELFGLPAVAPMPNADEALAAAKRASKVKAEETRIRNEQQRVLREQRVTEWRAGASGFMGMHPDTLLRVNGDIIQTSRGADMPVAHAPAIWAMVQRCLRSGNAWHTNGHTLPAGVFKVDAIQPDGTLKAGCHTIAYSELERIACTLGLHVSSHA